MAAEFFIQDSNPALTNLIVSNNAASANGGGIYVVSIATVRVNYSSPMLTNVIISNNTAARGGGLYTQNGSPMLTNVTLSGNSATGGAGGGMNNQVLDESTDEYSIPVLTNVTFSGNLANGGGGMFSNNSNPVLTNVTFSGNTANIRGGAILNEGASPIFRNVTFSGNTAPAGLGGAIRNIQNALSEPSHPQILNSILWGNGTEEITGDGTGGITLVDSIVQGGCPAGNSCTNVLNANPNLGALANNGSFTQTRALGVGSAAIDAGGVNSACDATDQRGIARPQGSGCDMGAYELEASVVLTFTPTHTATSVPTNTPVPSTATFTATYTPTATPTFTPTFTPTSTATSIPPTATFTPTSTFTPSPTNTSVPPTATFTSTATFTPSPTFTPLPAEILYLSSTTDGTAGGVAFADEDILAYNKNTGVWSMYFDGSDVGITSDVDAFFRMSNGTILLSVDTDGTIGTLGIVDDSTLFGLRQRLLAQPPPAHCPGISTDHVGLTTTAEDIDAIGFAPDGRLVISTLGAIGVTGVSGNDEDLTAFTATTLGSTTSGTWALYFDGSDVGLNEATSEQINGIWIEPATNKIYLTTAGAFSVPGLSGAGSDVFICTPAVLAPQQPVHILPIGLAHLMDLLARSRTAYIS